MDCINVKIGEEGKQAFVPMAGLASILQDLQEIEQQVALDKVFHRIERTRDPNAEVLDRLQHVLRQRYLELIEEADKLAKDETLTKKK